jgi:lipopolysaccharide transport system permease protein
MFLEGNIILKINIELLSELVKKEIKIRYKNSYSGYFWSLANPAIMAVVFYYVFKLITRVQVENYALLLVSGLFLWHWISNSISASLGAFIGNAGLIKKTNFDKRLLVAALVVSEGFNFLTSLPVIFSLMYFYSVTISIDFLIFPVFFISMLLFIFSIALFVATVNVYFRDMERIVSLFLMVFFYFTPILYTIEMIPQKYFIFVELNPFYYPVAVWKSMLFGGISLLMTIKFLLLTIVLFLSSLYVYSKNSKRFAEVL